MNIKNKIRLLLILFMRSKTKYFSILISIVIYSFIIVLLSTFNSLNNYWSDIKKKSIDYRILLVSYDSNHMDNTKAKEMLNKYANIETIQDFSSYLVTMEINYSRSTKEETSFYLAGSTANPVKIVKGESLANYKNGEKVMICPKEFYPYFEDSISTFNKNKIINLNEKIGSKIPISFIGTDDVKEFQLVGIYDTNYTGTIGNTCYTTWDNVSDINLFYQPDVFENNEYQTMPLVVVLNSVDNVEEFESQILKDGFFTSGPVLKINTDVGNKIMGIMTLIVIIIDILLIILLINYYKKNIEKNKSNYGIFKLFGMENKELKFIVIFEKLIENIISIAISFPTSIAILYLINITFINKYILLNGLTLHISINNIFTILILSIILTCIIFDILIKKLEKHSVISMIRG